jgi:hypothetical protein
METKQRRHLYIIPVPAREDMPKAIQHGVGRGGERMKGWQQVAVLVAKQHGWPSITANKIKPHNC